VQELFPLAAGALIGLAVQRLLGLDVRSVTVLVDGVGS